MSDSAGVEPRPEEESGGAREQEEVLDAVPVLSGPPRILSPQPGAELAAERWTAAIVMPAVQAAAVAAGGFVAGATVVGLVHRRRRRSSAPVKGRRSARHMRRARARGEMGRAGELLQIVGSRSLLLDVHLLGSPAGDR